MTRTIAQNKQLHKLITDLNLHGEKADMVMEITQNRTKTTTELTNVECQALINHLQYRYNQQNEALDKQRKKILSICHELQWELSDGTIDWARLNAWLIKYGHKHKALNKYDAKELPVLVTQFENLQRSTYAK